jgi:hypothetical protein
MFRRLLVTALAVASLAVGFVATSPVSHAAPAHPAAPARHSVGERVDAKDLPALPSGIYWEVWPSYYWTSPDGQFKVAAGIQGNTATTYIQGVEIVENMTSNGQYGHYFEIEITDSGITQPGSQYIWSGPGGTGDAFIAANSSYYFYGPWYTGTGCGHTYKAFAWWNEGGASGHDTGGGYSGGFYGGNC